MFSSILGFVGLALGAIGAIGGFFAAQDRSEALDDYAEQRARAQKLEREKNRLRARREKMQLIREARIKRAAAVAAATAQGVGGSVRGGFGSIISQSNSRLGYLNTLMNYTERQNIFLDRSNQFALEARRASETASIFGGVGKLGGTIFSSRDSIASLF